MKGISALEFDELCYLGLEVSGFISMDKAKLHASQFAKAVLGELSNLIK